VHEWRTEDARVLAAVTFISVSFLLGGQFMRCPDKCSFNKLRATLYGFFIRFFIVFFFVFCFCALSQTFFAVAPLSAIIYLVWRDFYLAR